VRPCASTCNFAALVDVPFVSLVVVVLVAESSGCSGGKDLFEDSGRWVKNSEGAEGAALVISSLPLPGVYFCPSEEGVLPSIAVIFARE
jgi:hypothetical protein